MRREEAEEEAAWRNSNDERRARLEFYAFDASAGLAEDAWDVTMRLRPEPVESPMAPASAAARSVGHESRPTSESEGIEDLEAPAAHARERSIAARPRSQPRLRPVPQPRQRREPRKAREPRVRPRRRTGREKEQLAALAPPSGWLARLARVIGSGVILIAVVWVGLITALAVLVHAESLTGLAVYAVAVVVGLLAIALGFAIRRS